MYIVIEEFNDLEDNKYKYKKDDLYPNKKTEINIERIEALSSSNNLLKKPLIKKIELNDASLEQIIAFIKREKIELKEQIINLINNFNKPSENVENEEEFQKLKKKAKKMKLIFSDDIGFEELKTIIEEKENK